MDSDDDDLQLSASTLAALQEFKKEETERKEHFAKLSAQAEEKFDDITASDSKSAIGIDAFQEDWNLSQFWYDDNTANLLADELLDGADESTRIIIVSAPSVYGALSKRPKESWPTKEIYLLEFDDRFKLLAKDKFAHYDFARPLDLPKNLAGSFDRILIDPPFLSEDCQTKGMLTLPLVADLFISVTLLWSITNFYLASITARWLLKRSDDKTITRTIVCTGERMGDLIPKVYPDTKETTFHPVHGKGLSNEFRCYASYEGPNWKFA